MKKFLLTALFVFAFPSVAFCSPPSSFIKVKAKSEEVKNCISKEFDDVFEFPEEVKPVTLKFQKEVVNNASNTVLCGEYQWDKRLITFAKEGGKSTQTLILTHELSHWIDNCVLPKVLFSIPVGEDRFATEAIQNDKLKAYFDAVSASNTITHLRFLQSQPFVPDKAKTYIYYLLGNQEVFARAVTEYLSIKSGNEKLKSDFEKGGYKENLIEGFWKDDDFAPIYKALDELFQSLNLLKKLNESDKSTTSYQMLSNTVNYK